MERVDSDPRGFSLIIPSCHRCHCRLCPFPHRNYQLTQRQEKEGGGKGGVVLVVGGEILPGGVERRIYSNPSPVGDAPVRDGAESGYTAATR